MKLKILIIILFSFLMINGLSGQKNNKKITITGYVVDSRQHPVSEAIIMVDDVKTDSFTDEKGYFKIRVKSSAGKIGIFTFSSGMMEEPVNGRTRINFVLPVTAPPNMSGNKDQSLNEAIDIGYGTVKKKDITTPVNKIDGTNIKYVSYSSIYEMIRGEVAGVQVQGKSIKIRGVSSFNLSTEPLFVVDGMQVNSIDDISPQTVRSIEILKGSSAAIYGSQDTNGVILINTFNTKNSR
ncbi:MAG: hypothetical protein A2V50_05825 [Bacteroidetes bacterium RBG_19FT_COMBO_42_10]|nr:MAG: hypothetical protein A2V50_05825 [Bacteroidetes bacterium RBG_19FT_COMBO_42_10]